MDFAQLFRAFVTFKTSSNQYKNFRYPLPVTRFALLGFFSIFGFGTKAPKVLKLENQIKKN